MYHIRGERSLTLIPMHASFVKVYPVSHNVATESVLVVHATIRARATVVHAMFYIKSISKTRANKEAPLIIIMGGYHDTGVCQFCH